MSPGKYRKNSYLDDFKESSRFIGSFEITVPVEGRLLQASVRPQGDGIYSVVLNGAFLAHLVKRTEVWTDYFGKATELYQTVGELIQAHEKLSQ